MPFALKSVQQIKLSEDFYFQDLQGSTGEQGQGQGREGEEQGRAGMVNNKFDSLTAACLGSYAISTDTKYDISTKLYITLSIFHAVWNQGPSSD